MLKASFENILDVVVLAEKVDPGHARWNVHPKFEQDPLNKCKQELQTVGYVFKLTYFGEDSSNDSSLPSTKKRI